MKLSFATAILFLCSCACVSLQGTACAQEAAVVHYDIKATIDAPHSGLTADVTITVPESTLASGASFLLSPAFKIAALKATGNDMASSAIGNSPFPGVQIISVKRGAGAQHGPATVR